MDFNKIKKVYFVGIGGIGVSAIAKMMLLKGKVVLGSDVQWSEIIKNLKKLGAKIFKKHKAKNIPEDTDLLIYSSAVPEDNPERVRAKKMDIPQLSYYEFLGILSRQYFTIAVSGTNGKSTTTSILGLILEEVGLDPTIIVGSKVSQWKGNLRLSKPDTIFPVFVVEACEWRAHMLNLSPKIIVLTNIEKDHLDYYHSINHIIRTFQKYVEKLPKDGILILNNDDQNLKRLKVKSKIITYGISKQSNVMAKNINLRPGHQEFDLIHNSKLVSHILLSVPGKFNIYNVLAASAAAFALGVKVKAIKKAVENFSGIWRRFEKVADFKGATIINDYAHHPTAIAETIKATKEFYPNRRIIAVFQPHQHSRTKKLFKDFVKSFDLADLIIISEIYDVIGRDSIDRDVSSKGLVKAIATRFRIQRYQPKKVLYGGDLKMTKQLILKNIRANDVVLLMGAGNIYKIKLLDKK